MFIIRLFYDMKSKIVKKVINLYMIYIYSWIIQSIPIMLILYLERVKNVIFLVRF